LGASFGKIYFISLWNMDKKRPLPGRGRKRPTTKKEEEKRKNISHLPI
jgi:hypothetical protein